MTPPDPEDHAGDQAGGSSEPLPPARRAQLPSDVDAAFAAIVAPWAAEGAPHWPGIELADPANPTASAVDDDGPSSGIGTATPPTGQPVVDGPPTAPPAGPAVPPSMPPQREPVRPVEPAPGPRDHVPPEPDDHFVPPEPPPLPRLGLSSLAGIGLLLVGVVLLAVPGLLGTSIALGIVPGLMAMTAGLGWLVFGMRRTDDHDDDGPDGGAVL